MVGVVSVVSPHNATFYHQNSRQHKPLINLNHLAPDFRQHFRLITTLQRGVNPSCDLFHLRFLHAARSDGWRADADAAAEGDFLRVEWNAILVHSDAGVIERFTGDFAVQTFGAEIDEHQMIVRAAADDAIAQRGECRGERLRVLHNLLLVFLEAGLQRFVEADGFRRDDVHEGAALHTGEDLAVDFFDQFLVVRQDHAAAWAAQ